MSTASHRPARRAVYVCLTVALLAVAVYANHSWGNYHWARSSNPFDLQLGDAVSSDWDAYLAEASTDWNQSSVLNTTIVGSAVNPKTCKPDTGKVEVCSSSYGNNGWLGLAQIWVSGDHIVKGAVKVNDFYYNTPTYNTFGWRSMVMCQEIGHIFGLDHVDETFNNPNQGTCMDYTNNPDGPPDNYSPNQHDFDQLASIYSHLDGGGGGGGGGDCNPRSPKCSGNLPPAASDLDLDGPRQWGRLIRGSRQRGFSKYVLDFGGGNKVYTFVTWAR